MKVAGAVLSQVNSLPEDPGVYLMKNTHGVIIYIGKAKVLKNRVKSYFLNSKDRPQRLKHLVKQITNIDYIVTQTEVEAFLLEATLIKKHKPRYNIRLKDDKSYPYIKCTISESFPRFYLSRKVSQGEDLYYGPFTSSYLVRENIKFLNGLYKIRDCTNGFMNTRKRPCLTYEIKRCTGPCVDLVNKSQYKKQINQALKFLEGDAQKILKEVEANMFESAKNEDFESAAEYRDQLQAAQIILEKQKIISKESTDKDVIACLSDDNGFLISMVHVRKGRVIGQKSHFLSRLQSGVEEYNLREKLLSFLNQYYLDNFVPDEVILDHDLGKDLSRLFLDVLKERKNKKVFLNFNTDSINKPLLEMAQKNAEHHIKKYIKNTKTYEQGLDEIQKRFGLEQYPERIECFDISNFQGTESVGSQVVFYNGVPSPEDYRIYKIKTVTGSDDFASMKEVLSRRLRHTEYQDPGLIVIDGGKGQLAKAKAALEELGRSDLKVVGLAKSRDKSEFNSLESERTQERFFLPNRSNPITFKPYSPALKILTHIRDEAHRFAITHHRKRREKSSIKSAFDEISGLGPKGLQKLKDYLKQHPNWAEISADELNSNLKLNKEVVEQIIKVLKN